MEVCELHVQLVETLDRIDGKIDKIVERQSEQLVDIQHLKSTVDNGLRSTVKDTQESILIIKSRIETIERFSWFVEWITQLRNNLFKNSIAIAVIGGGIYVIIHFGDRLATALMK